MDKETINNYQKLISSCVWSYYRKIDNPNFDVEDAIQELWMKLLEYKEKNGKMPDYALAKKMCQNDLVDITRKGIHRNAFSYDFDEEGDRAEYTVDPIRNIESETEINELANMFPKGSKERMYIDFYLTKSGAKDTGIVPEITRTEDGYTDSNLAKMLGFKGTGDRGYKRFKAQMLDIIKDYYGKQ